jgi:hypothetical protein
VVSREAACAAYTLVLDVEIPYPSIADVFWLSGYAFLFLALLIYAKLFGSMLLWVNVTACTVVSAVSAVLISFLLMASTHES